MGIAWLNNGLGQIGWWIACLVLVVSYLRMLYANPKQHKLQVFLQLVSLYARYWMIWLLVWSLWHFWLDTQGFFGLSAIFSLIYLYISWVEPNLLMVNQQTIILLDKREPAIINSNPIPSTIKVAVIGDIHVGIFSTKSQLRRLVQRLNQIDVTAIFCVGDWVYHPGADLIGEMLIFKALNKPCYTVFSQDDTEQMLDIDQQLDNGNYLLANERLTQVLATFGIKILTDQALDLQGLRLMGVTDGIALPPPPRYSGQPTLLLTHDIKQLQANAHALDRVGENTLMIAGHTHGGQINLPLMTPALVNAMTGSQQPSGLQRHPLTSARHANSTFYQSWTTRGLGMTGLPFRFCCPPTIDILTIHIKA